MFNDKATCKKYLEMAQNTKESFIEKFYNVEHGYLLDVLGDYKIRPNQLFAISLSHPVIDDEKMICQILKTVKKKLLNNYGLKTLASEEVGYVDVYEGSLCKRDSSYHQGITWPWLLGLYYDGLKNAVRYASSNIKKEEMKKKYKS